MMHFEVKGSLPVSTIQDDFPIPKSIAIDTRTIVFLSGNIQRINYYPINDRRLIEVRVGSDVWTIEDEDDQKLFFSQFPEDVFEKASELYKLYLDRVIPF